MRSWQLKWSRGLLENSWPHGFFTLGSHLLLNLQCIYRGFWSYILPDFLAPCVVGVSQRCAGGGSGLVGVSSDRWRLVRSGWFRLCNGSAGWCRSWSAATTRNTLPYKLRLSVQQPRRQVEKQVTRCGINPGLFLKVCYHCEHLCVCLFFLVSLPPGCHLQIWTTSHQHLQCKLLGCLLLRGAPGEEIILRKVGVTVKPTDGFYICKARTTNCIKQKPASQLPHTTIYSFTGDVQMLLFYLLWRSSLHLPVFL